VANVVPAAGHGINALNVVGLVADVVTIAAGGIAIYLFLAKRGAVMRALSLLLSYSLRLTLHDFESKLDRLAELNMEGVPEAKRAVFLLREVQGQIRGNPTLRSNCGHLLGKIDNIVNPRTTGREERKCALVSEARELLRNLIVSDMNRSIGGQDE
jgi:hypothetical protein